MAGAKLQRDVKTDDSGDPNQPAPASKGVDVQAHGSGQGLEFVVHSASMRAVVGMLSSQVEAPVLDRTGLPGYYDFTLSVRPPLVGQQPGKLALHLHRRPGATRPPPRLHQGLIPTPSSTTSREAHRQLVGPPRTLWECPCRCTIHIEFAPLRNSPLTLYPCTPST